MNLNYGGLQQQRESEELKQKSNMIVNNKTESRGKNPGNNNNNVAESGVKQTSINQLNLECLANIFSHIPPEDRLEIKKVCEKWEEAVALSWYSVRKFDAKNISVPINQRLIIISQLLQKFCQYLTHLTIDYECFWMTGILKNNCKNIIYFDVGIKDPDFTENLCGIIGSMKKLKYLKVQTHDTFSFQALWDKLNEILPADIEEIHFLRYETITYMCRSSEIASALDKFKNLRCLTLNYFYLERPTIESILLNKNSLVYLDLTGCCLPVECPITLFKQLVNLEHLNLAVKNLTEYMIDEIIRNCQKLKYLGVNRFYRYYIQSSTFYKLKYLTNLEHLDFPPVSKLNYIDDNIMSDVFYNCKKLKYLNVGRGRSFSTLDFEAITKLTNLQYLNLYVAGVDSHSFINIASNCLELKELNIILYDLSEIALEKLTNLKKLEKLDLGYCANLTGDILSKIAINCKNLVDLDLYGCNYLTEDSLIQVGKLDNLKKLDISGIENVPIEMFDYFRKLEKLNCEYCPSVTDEAIKKVIDNCFNLSLLNLMQTGITVDTLVHAAKRKFPLKILNIFVNESVEDDYFSLNELKQKSYIIFNYETESRGKNPVNNNNNNNNIAKSEVKKTSINQLNLECLANIFSHIPPEDRLDMKKVCKKWEEAVALSWYSVKKFDAKNISVPIKKKGKILKQLLNKFCQHLTHLTIDYQYSWRTDVLKNNCKNIVYFDVFIKCSDEYLYSHHDTESLCEIIGSMKKLKYLKVHTRHEYPDLWNKLSEILPAEIEGIHFSKINWNVYSRGLSEIDSVLDKFKNLRRLTLQYFSLTTAIINLILLNKNSLIYLDLSGCNLQEACPIILFTQLVNLEHLNLGEQFGNINENMIITIAHNCQKLKYLCIGNGCYSKTSLSRSTFNELKYLNNLEHLDFSCVVKSDDDDDDDDDNLIRDVFNNCKKLKYMNVGRGENFSRLDIQAIAKLINLEYLDISLAKVDSQSFINIANNCLELKKLMIDLVDISEIALEKLTNLKKLEKLNLARCDNLTGNLLSKIVDNCKNLVDLDVAMCKNVTEDSLMQVVKLDNLKKLDVGWIENVPISMFFNFCKLEILVCYNCPTITDEVIIKVIDNCLKLSKLYLKKTGITVDTLVHAEQRKFPYKILKIQVNRFLHDEYLKLNRKPSHYLKIDYV